MQACPRLISRISIFPSHSTSAFFFQFSVSGSDSRQADGLPLATCDRENCFGEIKCGVGKEVTPVVW